jgi:hypothetical protein
MHRSVKPASRYRSLQGNESPSQLGARDESNELGMAD